MPETTNLLWTPQELSEYTGDARLRIIDVRTGEEYAAGHIPGAAHFPIYGLNTYDTDEAPLRSFVHMWAFLLGRAGISPGDRVVFYEDLSGMTAARGLWFLEYLGHGNVHILDGGTRAWRDAGLELTRDAEPPTPVTYDYSVVADRVATHHDMRRAIGDPESLILDTRGDGEWFGTDQRAARNGTIPSAVHLEWVHLLRDDGQFKAKDELEALFRSRAIPREKQILALCNTGYRSAHAYVALRLLGYPRVRNYVSSWQEWGNRDGLPVVTPKDATRAPNSALD